MSIGRFLLFILGIYSCCAVKNAFVKRTINLNGLATRVEHEITVEQDVRSYEFSVHPSDFERLSFISAWQGDVQNRLSVNKVNEKPNIFKIDLKRPANRFTVVTTLVDSLEAKPTQIKQNEKQFMKFTGNVMFFSEYPTVRQETHIRLPPGDLLRYSLQPEPVSKSKNLVYGPYENIDRETHIPLHVHFEFSRPMLLVKEMTRHIEISHWGNIAIEETFEIQNSGAQLVGPFSRLDFDMGIGRDLAVSQLKTALPAAAKDIYYRDEIGNISTSTVADLLDIVEVQLAPRFPLMGGWKTKYTLGYNVPAYEFLHRSGSQFSLKMRFIDHVYDDQVVEDLLVKIVLPEMVSDIEFVAPYPVEELPREILKTYLDTSGRTVLVFKAKNLIAEHIQDFTLNYKFHMIYMLREPLMLITAFVVILVCVLIYTRLDFAIFRDEKTDLQLRTQALADEVQEICRKRALVYDAYEDMIKQFKANKNPTDTASRRRNLETENKTHNQSLIRLQSKMADIYSDGVEKLKELINLDTPYRDLVQESLQLAERLVAGKITKPQYQSSDNDLDNKKTDIIGRMDSILENL